MLRLLFVLLLFFSFAPSDGALFAQNKKADSPGDVFVNQLAKGAANSLYTILSITIGWIFGKRLTVYWAIRQKRRELELAQLTEFYNIYGDFFATWKLWNYQKRGVKPKVNSPATTRWDLLIRASETEARLEALLLKLSSERNLSNREIEYLGRLRQGMQTLRESIRQNQLLGWIHADHPEYVAFKHLACQVSEMLSGSSEGRRPARDSSTRVLRQITAPVWKEGKWSRGVINHLHEPDATPYRRG